MEHFMKLQREDIVSSFVVFIVALPLSLGVALASGASTEAGLITAVLGGVLCGLLSGAPLVVAGPAAGLTVFVYQLIQQHGIKGLALVTILAGVLQILMGALKLGRFFSYVPRSVLEGMLSAIGFIIACSQLHVLLGAGVPTSVSKSLLTLPESLQNVLWPIVFCGALAVAIQVSWNYLPKKFRWIPGALPAVIIATLLSLAWDMPRVKIADFFATIGETVSSHTIAPFLQNWWGLIVSALGLAIVASAETLLTAIALDGITTKRDGRPSKANLDRELLAHGTTNAACGFVGGLPLTGVIVRSAVNVNSGARTRLSTILHGLWIAVFVIFAPHVLQQIPLTALAAVLVVTGFKLLNIHEFRKLLAHSKPQAALWAVTFFGILFSDLLTGLGIGMSFYLLQKLYRPIPRVVPNKVLQPKVKEEMVLGIVSENRMPEREQALR